MRYANWLGGRTTSKRFASWFWAGTLRNKDPIWTKPSFTPSASIAPSPLTSRYRPCRRFRVKPSSSSRDGHRSGAMGWPFTGSTDRRPEPLRCSTRGSEPSLWLLIIPTGAKVRSLTSLHQRDEGHAEAELPTQSQLQEVEAPSDCRPLIGSSSGIQHTLVHMNRLLTDVLISGNEP